MIVQAACRVQIPRIVGYQIIPLHRHGDIGKIFKAFGFEPGQCKIFEQGFIDSRGNFYNRHDALIEFLRCEQLPIDPIRGTDLFSENIY